MTIDDLKILNLGTRADKEGRVDAICIAVKFCGNIKNVMISKQYIYDCIFKHHADEEIKKITADVAAKGETNVLPGKTAQA
jgi:hypothetical protein